MKDLGKDPSYPYIQLQYLDGWQPEEGREWAASYIRDDGSEDMEGFVREFERRHPYLFQTGPSYIPPSVNHYLRHSSMGQRMDVDWELAHMPMSEGELEEIKALEQAEMRKRRQDAIAARKKAVEESQPPEAKVGITMEGPKKRIAGG